MRDLLGKVAIVTGGSSGIGEGLAKGLAREGCKVVIADIVKDRAEAVANQILEAGGTAAAIACDVSERASVQSLKSEANRLFGRVSIVCTNAGVTLFERLVNMTDEDIDWLLQVNLHGTFHCLRAFLPDMLEAQDGHFVATSSFAGLLAPYFADHAPYVAAKSGLIGLMFTMRRELAGSGVGMTVLCPGKVATRITESLSYRPQRFGGPSGEIVTLPLGSETQVERTPDEVAQMVLTAIHDDRAMVVTHSNGREPFLRGFVEMVGTAFDDVAEWEKRHAKNGAVVAGRKDSASNES